MNQKQAKKKQDSRSGRPVVSRDGRTHTGQVIRKYRAMAGIGQAELASKLGFTKTAVGNWELGLTRPDLDTVPRLCDALRIPVTELLGLPAEAALPAGERCLLDMYRQLDRYNRHTVSLMMERLLFRQDTAEKARLRNAYQELRLYEEAAAAGIGVPMQDDSESEIVYAPKSKIPGNADAVIRVNGASMEPVYPHGCCVYVSSGQDVAYGQTGIFIVNGEAFIKEYQPEGLVSLNRRFRPIRVGEGADVRCCGRVVGIVDEGDIASGALLEKIEAAFEEGGE